MEGKLDSHDKKIALIFEYLQQFEKAKSEREKYKNRPKIGFKNPNL
ncbi:MAG: hypothetical protein K9H49_07190 [Bacteroidales bacterium]|nr:hypothetical protein [Bacteroidales bacterium]MCF8390296.1 hypothetical protein [Bacteroidales bacterium]